MFLFPVVLGIQVGLFILASTRSLVQINVKGE